MVTLFHPWGQKSKGIGAIDKTCTPEGKRGEKEEIIGGKEKKIN